MSPEEIAREVNPRIRSVLFTSPKLVEPDTFSTLLPSSLIVDTEAPAVNAEVTLLFHKLSKITYPIPDALPVAEKFAPVVMLIVNGVPPVPPDTFRTI